MSAQVAGQQGKYLASLLSQGDVQPDRPLPPTAKPFKYASCRQPLEQLALSCISEHNRLLLLHYRLVSRPLLCMQRCGMRCA